MWASHCSGFSCSAQALGAQASVAAARGSVAAAQWALEHRLSSCDAQALLLCMSILWLQQSGATFCCAV